MELFDMPRDTIDSWLVITKGISGVSGSTRNTPVGRICPHYILNISISIVHLFELVGSIYHHGLVAMSLTSKEKLKRLLLTLGCLLLFYCLCFAEWIVPSEVIHFQC